MHASNFAAVQQLAKWLYPQEFRDLDPRARLEEFHRRFMPVAHNGTWMIALDESP
jgi:iron complex transport system substrate-binding protein